MKQRLGIALYYSAVTSPLGNATGIPAGKEWDGEVMIHGHLLLIIRVFLIAVGSFR
jgi:hypothetical protein